MFGTSCFQRNPCPKQENPLRAGEGVRTLDNDIGNVVLCQLSYARKITAETANALRNAKTKFKLRLERAGEGVRTLDNDIGNVVLCQLSYARKTRASEAFQAPNNARRRDYIKSFAPRKGYSQKSASSRRVEVATLS